MHRNNNLQEMVEATMKSLDGMDRASANPHLYTRIKNSLEDERSGWAQIARFLSKPAVAIPLVGLVILMNILTLTSAKSGNLDENNDQLITLAQDYSFQPSNILDNSDNQP